MSYRVYDDPRTGRVGRDSDRTLAIAVYGLYLLSLFTAFPALLGVVIAHLRKAGARGSVYESHFNNQIRAFWVSFLVSVVAFLIWWTIILIPVSWILAGFAWLYLAWKSLKGLVRILDDRPY